MAKGIPAIAPAKFGPVDDAAEAFGRVEAEVLGMDEDEVGRVTADIPFAASIALGALQNLRKLRERFVAAFTDPPLTELDRLGDYALAALYAHLRARAPTYDQEQMQVLMEEARPLREQLLVAAEMYAAFAVIDAEVVAGIRAGKGHLDLAQDLLALATLYNANWSQMQGSPVTAEMVQRSGTLGFELLQGLGARTVGEAEQEPEIGWAERRARAFRLLVRAYGELRHATAYVRRHEGDAAQYAPSLHLREGSPRVEEAVEELVGAVQGSIDDQSEEREVETAPVPTPVGHPGSDPFIA